MGRPLLYDEVPVGPCKVRAIFSWSGESEQDLGFVEGDIIEVLNTGDGDWWTGKLKRNRMVGHFPRNFAEYVDEGQETMSAAAHLKATKGSGMQESTPSAASFAGNASASLADLQISDPLDSVAASKLGSSGNSLGLGASGSSQRSTKSAQEILKDISEEFNRGYLDDINIKSQPEELLSPELGLDDNHTWGIVEPVQSRSAAPADNAEMEVPPPTAPPHKVPPALSSSRRSQQVSVHSETSAAAGEPAESVSKSEPSIAIPQSSALTGPVIRPLHEKDGNPSYGEPIWDDPGSLDPRALNSRVSMSRTTSPSLHDEIPFDPKAYQPETPIGDHIGSHLDIDTSAYSTGLGHSEEKPMSVSKTRPSSQKNKTSSKAGDSKTKGSSATVVMFPTGEDDDAGRNRFFEKLFPKNSQIRLRRSTSRASQKSVVSSMSTKSFKAKLKGIKSMFSFAPLFKPDEDLYPSNGFVRSEPTSASKFVTNSYNKITDETSPRNGGGVGLSVTDSTAAVGSSYGAGRQEKNLGGKWIQIRRDLYRAKTLTERDVIKRRRAMELQGINCDDFMAPLIDQAEVDFHDYRLEDFTSVDEMVLTMSTWPQLMTPAVFASSRIGRHLSDPVERVRAVFLVCATHISHVSQTEVGNNVMQSRKATPKELAQTVAAMINALDVECLVVEGHLRTAKCGSLSVESSEHSWNAVKLEGEWRFLDCFCAAAGSSVLSGGHAQDADATTDSATDGEDSVNLFYFLTPPTQLIFTHVPDDQKYQFLKPSLPTATAVLLPVANPAAFAHGVSFDKFWLGMTRLSDLDMSEFTLNVPNGTTDLVARVNGENALAQAHSGVDGGRKVRIKSFVPYGQKQALLQIFAQSKIQAPAETAELELLWTLELRHVSGESNNAPFEFVRRFNAPNAANSDLYVIEPQCRVLGGGDLYTFRVEHFPASPDLVKQPKLAIQSPSGRITKLVPFGTDLNDTFKATVKTLEVGTWRAVVRPDENENWVPFAEWFCE